MYGVLYAITLELFLSKDKGTGVGVPLFSVPSSYFACPNIIIVFGALCLAASPLLP